MRKALLLLSGLHVPLFHVLLPCAHPCQAPDVGKGADVPYSDRNPRPPRPYAIKPGAPVWLTAGNVISNAASVVRISECRKRICSIQISSSNRSNTACNNVDLLRGLAKVRIIWSSHRAYIELSSRTSPSNPPPMVSVSSLKSPLLKGISYVVSIEMFRQNVPLN